jgi:hypothetical protein
MINLISRDPAAFSLSLVVSFSFLPQYCVIGCVTYVIEVEHASVCLCEVRLPSGTAVMQTAQKE